jgi:hypothetical protein
LSPPTFLLFVNRDELFSDQYKKYLAGEMRKAFGYEGCPVVMVPKARPKTIEPVRKHKSDKPARPRPGGKQERFQPRASVRQKKQSRNLGRPRGTNRAKGRR